MEKRCFICGCTDTRACVSLDPERLTCSWVNPETHGHIWDIIVRRWPNRLPDKAIDPQDVHLCSFCYYDIERDPTFRDFDNAVIALSNKEESDLISSHTERTETPEELGVINKSETIKPTSMEVDQQTDFFTLLEGIMNEQDNLTLTIKKVSAGNLSVAVRPQIGEASKTILNPLLLVHPAADLNQSFFKTVTAAVGILKSFEDELGVFKAGLSAPEKAKPEAKASGAKKSTPPVKKSAPKAPVKKVTKPTVSPEEKKKKEDEDRKLKAKKLAEQAEKTARSSNPAHWDKAIKLLRDAMKLDADPAYAGEIKKIEAMKLKKQNGPIYEQIDKYIKAINFGAALPMIGKILKQNPDDERANEFKAQLIVALGEGTVNQGLNL